MLKDFVSTFVLLTTWNLTKAIDREAEDYVQKYYVQRAHVHDEDVISEVTRVPLIIHRFLLVQFKVKQIWVKFVSGY
jgi:hypothetical protein